MIVGSVADDKVVNTVELYSDRLISKEESLRRLKYYKPNFKLISLIKKLLMIT